MIFLWFEDKKLFTILGLNMAKFFCVPTYLLRDITIFGYWELIWKVLFYWIDDIISRFKENILFRFKEHIPPVRRNKLFIF